MEGGGGEVEDGGGGGGVCLCDRDSNRCGQRVLYA